MIYATVFYSVQLDFFLSPFMNNAWKSFLCWRLEHKLFFFFLEKKKILLEKKYKEVQPQNDQPAKYKPQYLKEMNTKFLRLPGFPLICSWF